MQIAATVVAVAVAYLIGSISFAIVVSYGFGLADPRSYGSKNPGATNMLRSGSKIAAALTLLGDGVKGWIVVFLARLYAAELQFDGSSIALIGLAAFLGHLYPAYFRFQGGKGVATSLGVLLGFNPWLGLATASTWIVIFVFFRISSMAALIAALFAPVYSVFLFGINAQSVAVFIMSALIFWRHRSNIRNLLSGTEDAVGKPPAADAEHTPEQG
jgi:acyl phosphate:glycerol-3-phosphate acyltransferase